MRAVSKKVKINGLTEHKIIQYKGDVKTKFAKQWVIDCLLLILILPLGQVAGAYEKTDDRQFLPSSLGDRQLEVLLLKASEMVVYVEWPDGGNALICEGIPGNFSKLIDNLKKRLIGRDTVRRAAAALGWKPRIDRVILTRLHRINTVGLASLPKAVSVWELWLPASSLDLRFEPSPSVALEQVRGILYPWLKKAKPLVLQSLYEDKMSIAQTLSGVPVQIKVAKLSDRPEEAGVWIRYGRWDFLLSPQPGAERVVEEADIILGSNASDTADMMDAKIALTPGQEAWFITDGEECYKHRTLSEERSVQGGRRWRAISK